MDNERPTVTITDEDRRAAKTVMPVVKDSRTLVGATERIAWAIAVARAEGHAAGLAELERSCDLAHAAGYDEGYSLGYDAVHHP